MNQVVVSRKEKGGAFHEPWCPYVKKIKKENRQQRPENLVVKKGYCECKFCRSVRGIVYNYRKNEGLDAYYDPVDDAMCVKTDIGFWKLLWYENVQEWRLFHMNGRGNHCFDPNASVETLMRGSFHRQEDFLPTGSANKAIKYILAHDKSYKALEEGGLKNLPRSTPKQRLHYRQAKNKKRKESIRNVFKIFRELERSEK